MKINNKYLSFFNDGVKKLLKDSFSEVGERIYDFKIEVLPRKFKDGYYNVTCDYEPVFTLSTSASLNHGSIQLVRHFNEFGFLDWYKGELVNCPDNELTKIWFDAMSKANMGKKIYGKTYAEAFEAYHSEKIKGEYNYERLKGQAIIDSATMIRDRHLNAINNILGKSAEMPEVEQGE